MSCRGSKPKLYRDPKNGKIGGVCAGIADYMGMEVWFVRILAFTFLLFGGFFTFVAYFAACLILDKAPVEQVKKQTHKAAHTVKQRNWQSGSTPGRVLESLKDDFDRQDKQLQAMEAYVTSSRFKVDREFNNL
ncbi:envelope stress response membrane protein PspC [Thaumasiovibrio subtropicus]|uniref:envelope stress response membrane protein PspC n=1 Tax=Thaumasiovibrio subtropicus TaxID=1891207 RepID=UPI000B35E378|nr:envelope stress response membrane protein PspC [Thaumasiovibrio subtropicus]